MHQAVAEHAKEYARIQRFNLVRCIRLYWMRRFWFRCCHEAILQREFEIYKIYILLYRSRLRKFANFRLIVAAVS